MKIPTFSGIIAKENIGEPLNPLERFVHDNVPAGIDDEMLFNLQLANALEYVIEASATSHNKASVPCRWYKNGCDTCTCNPPAQARVA